MSSVAPLSRAWPSSLRRLLVAVSCAGTLVVPPTQVSAGSPESAGRRQYAPVREVDILHVAIDVTPDFEARGIAATTALRFKPLKERTREVTLDAVDLRINRVTASEPIQAWQNTDTQLIVTFTSDLPRDRDTTLTVTYTAEPKHGLYFRTPEMGYPPGDTHLFTQGEAIWHRHWFPCFDAPNEKFTSEVTCRVPEGMTALSNGRLVSSERDSATRQVAFHWRQEKPHVNYLIAIAAGYFRQLEARHGDLELTFHTPPSEFAWAEGSFRDTADMMAYFENEIGVPYPWARYAQVCVHDFVAGGMENTSLTILTHHTLFPPETENLRSSQGLVAHELVHQWFGDLVTCKDWSHLWLNEGFATYYEALYDRHKNGRDAFLWNLWGKARGVLDQTGDTTPIVWRGFDHPDEQFSFRAYPKGAWVLHMLRSQLGEDLFRRCVRTFLERHAFGSVTTEDFNDVIEELSGRSWDAFFDQWVYHGGCPELEVSYAWDETTKLAKLGVRQTHAISDKVLLFNVPLPVRFTSSAGVTDRTLTVKERDEDFYVALAEAPAMIRFDPDLTLLARIKFTPPAAMLGRQLTNQSDLMGRVLAVQALADRKDKETVARLKQALNEDPFYGVRTEAARALQQIRSEEALEALLASTAQTDAQVRKQVRESLQAFYRDSVLASARQGLETESNPDILAVLLETLGPYASDATRELLLRYLRSESFRHGLAQAAVGAMRAQDDPAFVGPLLETLRAREAAFTSRDFAQALNALAHLARKDEDKRAVREFLTQQVNHPKSMVQRAALNALGTLGDPQAIAVVETFTRGHRDSPERRAAEATLGKLRAARPPADEFRALRDEVLGFQKETRDLRQAIETLRKQFEASAAPKPATPPESLKDD